jgi:hypothetical protein
MEQVKSIVVTPRTIEYDDHDCVLMDPVSTNRDLSNHGGDNGEVAQSKDSNALLYQSSIEEHKVGHFVPQDYTS